MEELVGLKAPSLPPGLFSIWIRSSALVPHAAMPAAAAGVHVSSVPEKPFPPARILCLWHGMATSFGEARVVLLRRHRSHHFHEALLCLFKLRLLLGKSGEHALSG